MSDIFFHRFIKIGKRKQGEFFWINVIGSFQTTMHERSMQTTKKILSRHC